MFHVVWYQYALTEGYQVTLLSLSRSVFDKVLWRTKWHKKLLFWPSSVIRFGPLWHNDKITWANIVYVVLDVGT